MTRPGQGVNNRGGRGAGSESSPTHTRPRKRAKKHQQQRQQQQQRSERPPTPADFRWLSFFFIVVGRPAPSSRPACESAPRSGHAGATASTWRTARFACDWLASMAVVVVTGMRPPRRRLRRSTVQQPPPQAPPLRSKTCVWTDGRAASNRGGRGGARRAGTTTTSSTTTTIPSLHQRYVCVMLRVGVWLVGGSSGSGWVKKSSSKDID
jgi:hypothetical protein